MPTTSIQKELQELSAAAAASPPGVLPPFMAGPNGADLYAWTATVSGPAGTPYARGLFFLDLRFPGNYPFSPPSVVLRTRVYHPNLAAGRPVASRALSADGWSAATTVADVLGGIRELLAEPAPHEAVVGSIAQQYLTVGRGWGAVWVGAARDGGAGGARAKRGGDWTTLRENEAVGCLWCHPQLPVSTGAACGGRFWGCVFGSRAGAAGMASASVEIQTTGAKDLRWIGCSGALRAPRATRSAGQNP